MAAVRLRAQELKQRQGEAGGLTRAGLCRAEQVLACEHDGNGLRLDGGGLGIALFGYSTKQLGLEAKGIKRRRNDFLLHMAWGGLSPTTGSGWCDS
jgi:hypothetical protein